MCAGNQNGDFMTCACGTGKTFETCCKPFITGANEPDTAEELMRARYTAYTIGDIDYIKESLTMDSRTDFDSAATKEWAESSEWLGLKIVSTKKGGKADKKGTVEFIATFKQKDKTYEHHEVSEFRKNAQGHWRFVDGEAHLHEDGKGHEHHEKQKPVVREAPKTGRNEPCPCGSGKKFKQCCLTKAA
jgi:SEC-C motif-containing protein